MRSRTLDPSRTGQEAATFEAGLKSRVVGQEDAIHQVVEMYQMYASGMSSAGRPIANLMFLGPTGSGKTRLVEATAECLLQNPKAVTKIDCGEFQHSHEIAKLIGSPPGYIGHRETNALLTQDVLDRHHTTTTKLSIVLFDEIEKASDALWNLLLGILDKATLTLGDNTKVDFSRSMIFMTSNVGAREMNELMKPRLGFARPVEDRRSINEPVSKDMARSGLNAAVRKFTPEFINRLDKMVVFKPLGAGELNRILDIELDSVRQRVANAAHDLGFAFALTASGRQFLLEEGTNIEYGARHLKRAIERLLVQPLSRLIASRQILNGDVVRVDCRPGSSKLTFSLQEEGLATREMKRLFVAFAS